MSQIINTNDVQFERKPDGVHIRRWASYGDEWCWGLITVIPLSAWTCIVEAMHQPSDPAGVPDDCLSCRKWQTCSNLTGKCARYERGVPDAKEST